MEVLTRVFIPILQNWFSEQSGLWERERGSKSIWHNGPIDNRLVEEINNICATILKEGEPQKLDFIVNSYGGSIEAAYQTIALLDRKFPNSEICFVVPKISKSAATVMALGSNKILFSQVGELGPLDVQIYRPGSKRPISGITIKKLVDDELKKDANENMKNWIYQKLNPEDVLEMKRFNDVAVKYLEFLLPRRMFKGLDKSDEKIKTVIKSICEDFPSHSFVIDKTVAVETLGLNADFVSEKEELILQNIKTIWDCYESLQKGTELEKENLILQKTLDKMGESNV